MAAFQLAAVENVVEHTDAALDEQGIPAEAVAALVPRSLVGVASDGRGLGSLLTLPDLTDYQFDRIVATQLQDVARQAAAVERAVRPAVTHYVRAVNPSACGRCVVLAGVPSPSEVPFRRHPNCACICVPSDGRRGRRIAVSPRDAFDAMSEAERENAFTKAGAEAIRLGADPIQVVNARRGMSTSQGIAELSGQTQVRRNRRGEGERIVTKHAYYARGRLVRDENGLYTTTEGTSGLSSGRPRGLAGKAMRRAGVTGPRLMPETIAQIATDEADHLRLLRAYGYIT